MTEISLVFKYVGMKKFLPQLEVTYELNQATSIKKLRNLVQPNGREVVSLKFLPLQFARLFRQTVTFMGVKLA